MAPAPTARAEMASKRLPRKLITQCLESVAFKRFNQKIHKVQMKTKQTFQKRRYSKINKTRISVIPAPPNGQSNLKHYVLSDDFLALFSEPQVFHALYRNLIAELEKEQMERDLKDSEDPSSAKVESSASPQEALQKSSEKEENQQHIDGSSANDENSNVDEQHQSPEDSLSTLKPNFIAAEEKDKTLDDANAESFQQKSSDEQDKSPQESSTIAKPNLDTDDEKDQTLDDIYAESCPQKASDEQAKSPDDSLSTVTQHNNTFDDLPSSSIMKELFDDLEEDVNPKADHYEIENDLSNNTTPTQDLTLYRIKEKDNNKIDLQSHMESRQEIQNNLSSAKRKVKSIYIQALLENTSPEKLKHDTDYEEQRKRLQQKIMNERDIWPTGSSKFESKKPIGKMNNISKSIADLLKVFESPQSPNANWKSFPFHPPEPQDLLEMERANMTGKYSFSQVIEMINFFEKQFENKGNAISKMDSAKSKEISTDGPNQETELQRTYELFRLKKLQRKFFYSFSPIVTPKDELRRVFLSDKKMVGPKTEFQIAYERHRKKQNQILRGLLPIENIESIDNPNARLPPIPERRPQENRMKKPLEADLKAKLPPKPDLKGKPTPIIDNDASEPAHPLYLDARAKLKPSKKLI